MSGPTGHDVMKEAAKMMSDCLLKTEGLSRFTEEELLARLEITKMALTGVLGTSLFLSDDGFSLCKALGFDIGIAVRRPDGSEFIFYPAKNFGPNSMQSSPRFARQEVPDVPPVPLALTGAPSDLPLIKKNPIGFLQQFLTPTIKANIATSDAVPLPEFNGYKDLL
jgi:hypothetical protein